MKNNLSLTRSATYSILLGMIISSFLVSSCSNEFEFQSNNKPAWLGESIYDQLQHGYEDESGKKYTFSVFLKLIDDIEYTEVLKRTGSKTLFVSDDEAFKRFFQSNNWGVSSYEQLTIAQKKLMQIGRAHV